MRWWWVILAVGCGRIGFSPVGPGATGDGRLGNGDGLTGDGSTGDAAPACVASSFNVSNTAAVRSWSPALGWNGSTLGVTWTEDPGNADTMLFRTATLSGALGSTATLTNLGAGEYPSIAVDAATFRLALAANFGMAHRAIYSSASGAAPVLVTSGGKDDIHAALAVLSPGVVAYSWSQQASGSTYIIQAAVFDGGTKTLNDVTIANGLGLPYAHDLATNGSELAAFFYAGNMTSGNIMMARVSSTGTVVATPTISPTNLINSIEAKWVGDRYIVAWLFNSQGSVGIAYVDATGNLLSPVMTAHGGGPFVSTISVGVGATGDLVAWNDVATSASFVVPVARDGTVGAVQMLANTTAIGVTWAGTMWALGAAQAPPGSPEDIYAVMLCP